MVLAVKLTGELRNRGPCQRIRHCIRTVCLLRQVHVEADIVDNVNLHIVCSVTAVDVLCKPHELTGVSDLITGIAVFRIALRLLEEQR